MIPADRPTTVAEAVEAGARVLYARDLIPAEHALDPEWESLVVGSTGQQWRAMGYRDTIRAVLSAVGYADLLTECRDTWRMFEASVAQQVVARAEIARLREGIEDAIPYLGEREQAEPILRAALAGEPR